MLPFAFEHSVDLQLLIHDAIAGGKFQQNEARIPLKVPDACIDVGFTAVTIRIIRALAEHKAKEFEELGYTRHKQYRAMAAGHALLRTWKKPVIQHEDIEFLKRIDAYVSYTQTRIL